MKKTENARKDINALRCAGTFRSMLGKRGISSGAAVRRRRRSRHIPTGISSNPKIRIAGKTM
jgi:hypothetical protein